MSRTIDADTLTESIRKIDVACHDPMWVMAAALTKIDLAPTIGGWVNIEERMPPLNTDVLVFARQKMENITPGGIKVITRLKDSFYFGSEPIKTTEPYWHSPFQYFTANYNITHWMPLPEDPDIADQSTDGDADGLCASWHPDVYGHDECWGTKERERCACHGNKAACDFYPDIRKGAVNAEAD